MEEGLRKVCETLQELLIKLTSTDTLQPLVFEQFQLADTSDTKDMIQKRILQKTSKVLNIVVEKTPNNNSAMLISKPILDKFEDLYIKIQSNDVKSNNLHTKYAAFKSQGEVHDILSIKNLIREFQKQYEISKENAANKREKMLKNNELNSILAVDGMLGCQPSHLLNYISNLAVGDNARNANEKHVLAVREIYKKIPLLMNGTDSVYFIAKVLLEIYNPFIVDINLKIILQNEIDNLENYLFKQAEYYSVIKDINNEDFISQIKELYCLYINKTTLLNQLANEQVTKFINHKQKNKRKNEDDDDNKKNKKLIKN